MNDRENNVPDWDEDDLRKRPFDDHDVNEDGFLKRLKNSHTDIFGKPLDYRKQRKSYKPDAKAAHLLIPTISISQEQIDNAKKSADRFLKALGTNKIMAILKGAHIYGEIDQSGHSQSALTRVSESRQLIYA